MAENRIDFREAREKLDLEKRRIIEGGNIQVNNRNLKRLEMIRTKVKKSAKDISKEKGVEGLER